MAHPEREQYIANYITTLEHWNSGRYPVSATASFSYWTHFPTFCKYIDRFRFNYDQKIQPVDAGLHVLNPWAEIGWLLNFRDGA